MLLNSQKLAPALLLLISLCLAYVSGTMLMAALWARQVNTFLLSWEEAGVEPEEKAWQVAFNAANKAISLYPGSNAGYYDRLGRVWEWRQFQHSGDDKAAFESNTKALEAYRESIATRPLWPYTWLSLAYTKLRLEQIDKEFIGALQQSVKLGPWRIKVNKRVSEMGLIAWFDLDTNTQALVVESIRRTTNFSASDARWLEKHAIDSNRRLIFCSAVTGNIKQKYKICSRS